MFPLNIFLAILAVSSLGHCQVTSCPSFVSFPNLDIEKQMGEWAINGLIHHTGERQNHLDCFHVTMSGSQFKQEPVNLVVNLEYEDPIRDQAVDLTLDAAAWNLTEPGRWTLYGKESTHYLHILHTDYDSYSLMALCQYDGQTELGASIAFASRGHIDHMPMSVTTKYFDFLKASYGEFFNSSFYQEISHDHDHDH